jgi:uncharacterized protein (DUF885 family)
MTVGTFSSPDSAPSQYAVLIVAQPFNELSLSIPPASAALPTSRRIFLRRSVQAAMLVGASALPAGAAAAPELPANAPDKSGGLDHAQSDLRPYYDHFSSDHDLMERYYSVAWAPDARAAMQSFYSEWQTQLNTIPFTPLSQDGQIDHILLQYHLRHALALLAEQETFQGQVAAFLPFAGGILALSDAHRAKEPIDGKTSAAALAALTMAIGKIQEAVEAAWKPGRTPAGALANKEAANGAMQQVGELQETLKHWFTFYDGYNPDFTWWAAVPYKNADAALTDYAVVLRVKVLGLAPPADAHRKSAEEDSDDPYAAGSSGATAGSSKDIIGHAIGEAGLQAELQNAMIPYTPQELIALANREFSWCDKQMRKASAEMGFGDNWHAALEKVKNDYVAPGAQPQMVVTLLKQAEDFLDAHDLITVPELARTTWRWRMIGPQQQLVSPFFLGGEMMQIAYPTDTMTYAQRISAMRANNINMSRATVFHELIPGHELQLYMAERFRAYRAPLGGTPFLIEGWALYWEMLMWELGFDRTPEQRVGALEWRMHRCARIIFSLSFHLGTMTPQQCIDLLIQRVGFEPDAAAGEVRRSFGGDYSPLYQCAYLLGGMQLRALRHELVPGKMTMRAFHDSVLRENEIPIEMIRASLTKQPLTQDFKPSWRFADEIPDA